MMSQTAQQTSDPSGLPWSAVIRRAEDGLCASVEGLTEPGPWEFAFYLMAGRDRQQVRWYGSESTALFEGMFPVGTYHTVAFVRRPGASKGAYRTSDPVSVDARAYDPGAWNVPITDHTDKSFSLLSALPDGIHRLSLDDGITLDLLAKGFGGVPSANAVLVCFSAAVQRAANAAPIFSGLRQSEHLLLPLVAVADPMLAQHGDLNLAWYAGSKSLPDLPRRIAKVLEDVARISAAPLVLFGGSGGGFACLSVLEHLSCPASAYVWNAQTSITRYNLQAVAAYVRRAAPAIYTDQCASSAAALAELLTRAGVEHDLTKRPRTSRHPVLYLQNRTDAFHVEAHMKPYAQANGISATAIDETTAFNESLCFVVGDWGKGHVAPPRNITETVLRGLANGESLGALRARLSAGGDSAV
jgi:hypothetical protein